MTFFNCKMVMNLKQLTGWINQNLSRNNHGYIKRG
jgi:hypothetical protein